MVLNLDVDGDVGSCWYGSLNVYISGRCFSVSVVLVINRCHAASSVISFWTLNVIRCNVLVERALKLEPDE